MFAKGPSLSARMFTMQRHAMAAGRNLLGKLEYGYHTGRHIAHALDRGYQTFKKIYPSLQPALANSAPGVAKAAKKAMGSYEGIRAAVQSADEVGQRVVGSIRREIA